jgi:hypothetical protein
MRTLSTAAVARLAGSAAGLVRSSLSAIRGFVRKLLRARNPGRETEAQAPESLPPGRPAFQVGSVRAVLRPRGLVEVDALVEPAWWDSDAVRPARDSLVHVERAPDSAGWLARPLRDPAAVDDPPGRTQATAPP